MYGKHHYARRFKTSLCVCVGTAARDRYKGEQKTARSRFTVSSVYIAAAISRKAKMKRFSSARHALRDVMRDRSTRACETLLSRDSLLVIIGWYISVRGIKRTGDVEMEITKKKTAGE